MSEELIFDAWTPMSFKRAMGNRRQPGRAWTAPTWVGDHARRLQAYTILQAYVDNAARHFLQLTNEDDRDDHREYGDAALLRNVVLSALLGDEQRVRTKGATTSAPGEDQEEDPEALAALEFQEWVEEWAGSERLIIKMQECERSSVTLGDGVYVLGWSAKRQRARLRVFDPGFYFPVLDDGAEDEYPRRVHIAWEMPQQDGDSRRRIRRMTWELGAIEARPDPDGGLVYPEDVDLDVDGLPVRQLPWNDEPTSETCYFTDAVWTLENDAKVDDLTQSTAEYLVNEDGVETDRLDLGIDFIPVVHVPNTIALQEHYGRSALAYVLQILDDLANADTDLQAASATTGTPPISISGAMMTDSLSYRPGTVFGLGDNGRMDVLDTSRSLDALLKYVASLLERLSVNGRTPEALLGRVSPSEVPSGLALQLSFGPLVSMVREMRLAREEKYSLLFKFSWRMSRLAEADGVPEQYYPTEMQFGSFLPADLAAAIEAVARLLERKAISNETAIAILMDAGLPLDDAAAEIERIQSRDFEGANSLLDATGDQGAVLSYLGRDDAVTTTLPPPPVDNE